MMDNLDEEPTVKTRLVFLVAKRILSFHKQLYLWVVPVLLSEAEGCENTSIKHNFDLHTWGDLRDRFQNLC